ncbi:response regulator [Virgibacillus sp. JSM 102003]|uniref:response regulator n=1 Tax=Virgibacillus sp. JSM 102003 TaxID=1562108 RepID=UPI0035C1D37C
MKVLIAEDELLERKAMRKFLENNFSEIEIIDEATNGREAIELARLNPPDIIFMDIKMPGINGLEAIEEVQNFSPSSKFILVSAYDSFDFAKQAMNHGVKEYILKPGKKEEIVKSILRVKKEIDYEVQQQIEKRNLIEESFITKLMHQPLDKEAYSILKEYFPSFKSGYFLVIQLTHPADIEPIRERLTKHLEHPFIVDSTDGRVACCILANSELNKSDILMQVRKIQLEFGTYCYIGIGTPYSVLGNFPKSYHEALTAAYQLTKKNNRKYGFLEENEDKDTIPDVIVQLLAEVEKGNEHESLQIYKDKRDFFTIDDHEDIYFNVKRMMEEQNIAFPENTISELDSDIEWQQFIILCCVKFQEHYRSKKLMEKVKEYIDEHYRQGITLEEMAAHVGLSPNYFSNVFKKEFGNTFVEFITGRRMNEAKHLIMENQYSLKEISYMVGYNDPNYFSRVFKRSYQMSPKKFQQQIFKK